MRTKSRFESLKEALGWGTPAAVPTIEKSGTIILSTTKQSAGETLDNSLDTQLTTFNSDPVVKESIIQFAQEIIGNGYFTTMSKDYKLELLGVTAKQFVDEWCYSNDIDNKILQIGIELVAFGNSFWYITKNGFQNIPIQAIYKAYAVDKATPLEEKYNLEMSGTYGSKKILWGDFIHFKINSPSEFSPISCGGIIHGLIAYPDGSSGNPSIWDIRKSMRKYLNLGFKKFSFANELWTFEGASDAKLGELNTSISEMPDIGQRVVTNLKGGVEVVVPQRTTSYDQWLKSTDNEFLMALANPSLKLGVEGFYTKATGDTASKMFGMKIESMRRIVKRAFEDLWIALLAKNGYTDALKAQVKMNFGSEEVSYTTSDLFAAVDKKLVSVEEARKILKESMKWKLEEELPKAAEQPSEEKLKLETLKFKKESEAAKLKVYEKLLKEAD